MTELTSEQVFEELFDMIKRIDRLNMDTVSTPYINVGFDAGVLWAASHLLESQIDSDYAPLKQWMRTIRIVAYYGRWH